MNTPYQEIDHAADLTLRALGSAQPTPGFTGRLKADLTQPALKSTGSHRRWFTLYLPLATLTGCCFLVMVLLTMRHRSLRAPASEVQTQQRAQGRVMPRSLSTPGISHRQPAQVALVAPESSAPALAAPSLAGPTLMAPIRLSISNRPHPEALPPPTVTGVPLPTQAALDAQALDDFYATSQPSVSSGPTHQEQLLRHVIQGGNSSVIASLEELRDTNRATRERAAFTSFFEPHPDREADLGSPVAPH